MIHWFWWYLLWLTVMCSLLVVEERKNLPLHAWATCQEHTRNFTHSQIRRETETSHIISGFVLVSQRMQFGTLQWFRRYFWITPDQLLLKPAVTVHPAAESLQLLLCARKFYFLRGYNTVVALPWPSDFAMLSGSYIFQAKKPPTFCPCFSKFRHSWMYSLDNTNIL